jgi:MOSC domain-containing protein YiiM
MTGKGQLLGIATRPAGKAPMNELLAAWISTEHGVDNDARGRPGRRQATVMTRSGWEAACAELGAGQLPWTTRRANLFVDGVDLKGKVGYDLRVGDAVLTISGETRPCEVMNQAYSGLMAALDPEWRGGVICRVTRSGAATVGCEVVLSRRPMRQLTWVAHGRARRLWRRCRGTAAAVVRRLIRRTRSARPGVASMAGEAQYQRTEQLTHGEVDLKPRVAVEVRGGTGVDSVDRLSVGDAQADR